MVCFMLTHLQISLSYDSGLELGLKSASAAKTVVKKADQSGEEGFIKLDGESGGLSGLVSNPAVAMLVYMASAFIIYKLIVSCTNPTYDVYAAAAAAGIYIIGEVMNISSSKNKLKEKSLEYKTYNDDDKIDDEQYTALTKERQMMEEIRDSAGKRAKMQMASSIAFGVAAGLAFFEDTKSKTLAMVCSTSASTASVCATACTPIAPITANKEAKEALPGPSAGDLTIFKTLEASIGTTIVSCIASAAAADAASFGTSGGACSAFAATAEGACSTYVMNEQLNEVACVPLSVASNNHQPRNELESWYMALVKGIVPPAAASGGLLGGLAGGLAGYLMVQAKWTDMLVSTPTKRGWLWAGLAAYGMVVYKNTKDTQSKAEANLNELNKLINRMDNTMNKGVSVSSTGSTTGTTTSKNFSIEGTKFEETIPCMNGSKDGKCAKLPPVKSNRELNANYGAMPQGLIPAFKDVMGFAQSQQGQTSTSAGADAAVEKINSNMGAVNDALRTEQRKLDLARKKLGLPNNKAGIAGKKMLSNMVSNASKFLKKRGQNPHALLASLGASAPNSSVGDNLNRTKELGKQLTGMDLAKSGGEGLSEAQKAGSDIPDFSFDMNEIDSEVAKRNSEFDKMAKKSEQLEQSGDSVIKDRSVSLFKVISVRYLKSGFKKLLEEIKE